MKVVILAGGFGTRLSEETGVRPKPMVEIGNQPIIWHIMKCYSHFGFDEFVVALGYKAQHIKEYFFSLQRLQGNLVIDLKDGDVQQDVGGGEKWKIHLVETGGLTMTGGRVKRLESLIGDEPFMLTYGDGVCDVDIHALLAFHKRHKPKATITAVRPPTRFGAIRFSGDLVERFVEKPRGDRGWINGGFMVLEPEIMTKLKGDDDSLEADLLEELAREGLLAGFRHDGFWQCMDTMHDKFVLQDLWDTGEAPWKIWA